MFGRSLLLLLGAGLLSLLAIQNAPADPPDPVPVPGVEVQGRGPIHEAFAAPVDSQPQASAVVPREPPAAIDEAPPDQKPAGDDVQWIPGYWQWEDAQTQFVWVSGFWRTPPPGRTWVPGHWDKVDDGGQWVSGYWAAAEQDQVTYLPPPPPSIDEGPSTPAPDDDSIYVPGCWVYRETQFRWRPGYWIAFQPDFVWVPAHYEWTPAGCVFVDGYWDYPLAERGLLFAPVCFDPDVLRQPDFVYTPQYVVCADFLPTALFVRSDCRHYYFGDYFDDRDARAGFVPWVDFRIGRHSRDPLFEHDRRAHTEGGWEHNMRDLYAARRNGDAVRPPRTLGQQDKLLRDIQGNNTVHVANAKQVNVLAPLNRAPTPAPLEKMPSSARLAQRDQANRYRDLGIQLGKTQHEIVRSQKAPLQAGDPPQLVKAPPPPQAKTPPERKPISPPPPVLPKEITPPAPPTPPTPHHKEVAPPPPAPPPAPPAPAHKEIAPPPPPAPPPVLPKETSPPAPSTPPAPHHKEVAPPPPAPPPAPPAPAHKEIAPPPPPVPPPAPAHPKEVTPPPPPPAPAHKEIAPPPPPPPPAPVRHKEVAPPPPPPPAPKPAPPPPATQAPSHHKK